MADWRPANTQGLKTARDGCGPLSSPGARSANRSSPSRYNPIAPAIAARVFPLTSMDSPSFDPPGAGL
jgi:hypothetical protein